jgi:tRNA wybutosine-synthesizing protein 1
MKPEVKKLLQNQHYSFAGNHSAVKVCTWTKKSLRDEDFCYKQKFYGIKSHLCCQMSPSVNFCQNQCIFCWRPIEHTESVSITKIKELDEPEKIIEDSIKAQKKQLSGFGGNEKTNKLKLKEAQNPKHFAISLTGEPTLYPKLPELIQSLHKKGKTTFLVTNGLNPEGIKNLILKKALPTQLYISMNAPDEKIYKKVCKPKIKDFWKKYNESLSLISKLRDKSRTTLRLTLVKGLNMVNPEEYAKLIKKANPLFLEVKAYMFVGYSRKRLLIENMPMHEEIKEFAGKISKYSDYKIIDEKKESRVVLLMQKDFKGRIMKFD